MKLVLQIKSVGSQEIREEVFDRLPLLIGRSKICDLVLDDALSSRQHCVIEITEHDRLRLVDLQSANGTLIDGKKIEKHALEVGQSFSIGDTEISLEKVMVLKDESTVHELTPIERASIKPSQMDDEQLDPTQFHKVEPLAVPEPISKPKPQIKEESLAPEGVAKEEKKALRVSPEAKPEAGGRQVDELSLKTPSVFKRPQPRPTGSVKDWMQVSVFWKNSLIDIQCFERGRDVKVGTNENNDFVLYAHELPDELNLLKILPEGLELNLHPSLTGVIETRGKAIQLEELRKTARQTIDGFCAFVPFQDRCLIEIGQFSFFIQAVRLRVAEPLDTPLVKEPLFSGVLGVVATVFLVFLVSIAALESQAEEKEEEVAELIVDLESFKEPQKPVVRRQIDPPQKSPAVKQAAVAQKKANLSGSEGGGAKAAGKEGARGREAGTVKTKARSIGFQTQKAPPKKTPPKGAQGKTKSASQARRGLRKDQGVGTGTPKNPKVGRQLGSQKPKPSVRVEDQGIAGVFGAFGGGGSASQGGELAGVGLGGRLEGALEGLEKGSTLDGQGSGGRGTRGRDYGGGGSSLEVGGFSTKGKAGGQSGFGLGSSGRKGESEVAYVQEEIEVREGLTREEIERVVRRHLNEIQACYEKSLIQSGNQAIEGRLKVGWTVNREGRAVAVMQQSSFGGQADLFNCVSRRIQTWQFPRPRGSSRGADVSWPFVFTKGG